MKNGYLVVAAARPSRAAVPAAACGGRGDYLAAAAAAAAAAYLPDLDGALAGCPCLAGCLPSWIGVLRAGVIAAAPLPPLARDR